MNTVKYEKTDRWKNESFKLWVTKGYKESYRRNWYIDDIVYSQKNDEWIILWKKKFKF